LLVLCRNYANPIHPQGVAKVDPNSDFAYDSCIDRPQHHKKIKQWFMNPGKFKNEIAAEQAKFVGKCIYHLMKSHPTSECFIKRECKKLIAARKHSTPNVSSGAGNPGQLRHLTDDTVVKDEPVEDVADSLPDLSSNDTNEDALFYFARVSNHYLRLVKSEKSAVNKRHKMDYPIIANSGANFHMFKELEFFTSMQPTQGHVILGDGKTRIPIQGIGTVKCIVNNYPLEIQDVRFVQILMLHHVLVIYFQLAICHTTQLSVIVFLMQECVVILLRNNQILLMMLRMWITCYESFVAIMMMLNFTENLVFQSLLVSVKIIIYNSYINHSLHREKLGRLQIFLPQIYFPPNKLNHQPYWIPIQIYFTGFQMTLFQTSLSN
jgi:hypothetical protein